MNSKGIIAVTDHTLCMKCLEKKATVVHKMINRGYGSCFDSLESKLQLCDDCDDDKYYKWFNQADTMEDFWENYKYEDEIKRLIDALPLESQELFWNTFDERHDWDMEQQDWIDNKLGELSKERCEHYGLPYKRKVTSDAIDSRTIALESLKSNLDDFTKLCESMALCMKNIKSSLDEIAS